MKNEETTVSLVYRWAIQVADKNILSRGSEFSLLPPKCNMPICHNMLRNEIYNYIEDGRCWYGREELVTQMPEHQNKETQN